MVIKLLFQVLVISLLIQLTTFGWRPLKRYKTHLSDEKKESARRLKETVQFLAENIGTRNFASYEHLNRAAAYITQRFSELGYKVETMEYNIDGKIFKNLMIEKSPTDPSLGTLIIGAHYDSCFNPGADDNASGVAGLLELARLLKDSTLDVNIRLVAFTNEEPPFFMSEEMGSRVYTRRLKARGEDIKAAIILEMLGYYSEKIFSQRYLPLMGPFYPHRANFIAVVGNFASAGVVRHTVKHYRSATDFPVEAVVAPGFIPGINFSDHWSFWQEGYPAIMVTDTAFMRSRHYHAQTDLPETLDYERMAEVVQGLKNVIVNFKN